MFTLTFDHDFNFPAIQGVSQFFLYHFIGISRQAYRAAVQTGTEVDWYCKSCAAEWSYISGEPVAASSRLENSDSMSAIYEPLHPPSIEVSWGPHLGEFLQQQFEGSTVGK